MFKAIWGCCILLLCGCTGGFKSATMASSNTQAASTAPPSTPTIDTLNYFVSKHLNSSLTGTHPMSQTVVGNSVWNVYWAASSFGHCTWDDSFIYLKEDHSGAPNPDYTFNSGVWMKRFMAVGEQISASANLITVYDANCQVTSSSVFPYVNTLEAHIPNYDLGGTLGIQDVIVLRYEYGTSFEKSYYSSEWGFVKWELFDSSSSSTQPSQTSTFNVIVEGGVIAPAVSLGCFN